MSDGQPRFDMKTLCAIYDLKQAPNTFDFLCYLALAECLRQFDKYDRIDLTILVDGFRIGNERELSTSVDEKLWRIQGILVQCVSICPTVKNLTITDRLPEKDYHFPIGYPTSKTPYSPKQLNPPFKHGAKPNECFKAPPFASELAPKADVTLTLRSSRNFTKRNVDLSDWIAFHTYLRNKGYKVAVIPDQENPETYSIDWSGDIYVPAAYDMRLRLAAYELAQMNIGSCHGPFTTLFYTNVPYLMFDHLRGGVLSPRLHESTYGFPVGGQHPWSKGTQVITWEDSTMDNLVRWFEECAEPQMQ